MFNDGIKKCIFRRISSMIFAGISITQISLGLKWVKGGRLGGGL